MSDKENPQIGEKFEPSTSLEKNKESIVLPKKEKEKSLEQMSVSEVAKKYINKAKEALSEFVDVGEDILIKFIYEYTVKERGSWVSAESAAEEKDFYHRAKVLMSGTVEKIRDILLSTKESPFSEGEVFNPEEEMTKVRATPKEDRKRAVEVYKKKLTFQKEGLGRIQKKIMDELKKAPDASPEELAKTAEELNRRYGLTKEQISASTAFLEEYSGKHKAIKETREKYPDNISLYKAVFGVEPKGQIEVMEGPMSLYFRCFDEYDYAHIFNGEYSSNARIEDSEKERAGDSVGVSVHGSLIPELRGVITAESSYHHYSPEFSKETFNHEEQHAIKKLFKEKRRNTYIVESIEASKGDLDEQLKLVRRFFRETRQDEEARAKDEIMAFFKEKEDARPERIKDILFESYNYFGEDEWTIGKVEQNRGVIFEAENLTEDVVKKIESEVNGVEYRGVVNGGVDAFASLRQGGLSVEESIGILIGEPLLKWPKIARRIREGKKSRGKKEAVVEQMRK